MLNMAVGKKISTGMAIFKHCRTPVLQLTTK